jgi:glycosyltransferase involved in cell wall biosynthesis
MRVLFLSRSSEFAGGNRSLLSLVKGLRGVVESELVAPARGAFTNICELEGVSYRVAGGASIDFSRPLQSGRTFLWWWQFLSRMRPDVVHVNDSFSARVLTVQAKWLKIPIVCHCRFDIGLEQLRWTFRHVPAPQAVIFNSAALQEAAGPLWRQVAPAARQHMIHNGIDLAKFPFRSSDGPPQRSDFTVMLLGRLIPVKGIEHFIDMAAILHKRGLPIRFRIVGGETEEAPGYRQTLQAQVRRLRLESSLEFAGYQADVMESLYASDVLVCSSHVEPFGRVLIEAMACGTPVVATKVGGIPEIVENEATGLLVPASNPPALARAVERLFHDRQFSGRLARAARQRVEEKFSEEGHCRRVLEVYQEIVGAVAYRRRSRTYAGSFS